MLQFAFSGLVALALTTDADRAPAENGVPAAWTVLPEDAPRDTHTWAALLLEDVRHLTLQARRAMALRSLSAVGRTLYRDPNAWAPRWTGAFEHLLDILNTEAGPIPGALIVLSRQGQLGLQLVVKGSVKAPSEPTQASPPWRYRSNDDGFVFESQEGTTLYGTTATDGWVRLSASPWGAQSYASGTLAFPEGFSEPSRDSWSLLYIRPELLARLLQSVPPLAAAVGLGEGGALVLRSDGGKTSGLRLLINVPVLEQLANTFFHPAPATDLLTLWGPDCTGTLNVALAPTLFESLPKNLDVAGNAKPGSALRSVLAQARGDLSVAFFGQMRDWALGLRFESAADAQKALPKLLEARPYVDALLTDSTEPEMHLQPGPGIEGIRAATFGPHVILTAQSGRMAYLRRTSANATNRFLGPLTPWVRTALLEPTVFSYYSVLGHDGWMQRMLGWGARITRSAMEPEAALPIERLPKAFWKALPQVLTAEGFAAAMTYDLTLTLRLQNSTLVLDILTSEI